MPGLLQPTRTLTWNDEGTVAHVAVKSLFSGKVNEMTLTITPAQYNAWQGGQHIQHAMPHLTPDEREFLLTGATPEEWDAEFGEDDDPEWEGSDEATDGL